MSEIYNRLEDEKFEFGQLTKEEQKNFLDFVKRQYPESIDVWKPLWTVTKFLPNPKIMLSHKFDLFFKEHQISFAELIKLQKKGFHKELGDNCKTKNSDDPDQLNIFESSLRETRERLDTIFRGLALVNTVLVDQKLYFNVVSVALSIAYFLKLYNGDFAVEPHEFLNDVAANCPILRSDHKEYLGSFGMIFKQFSERLALNGNPRIGAILYQDDLETLFGSRYLMSEVLYVCHEAVVKSITSLGYYDTKTHCCQFSPSGFRLIQKKLLFFIDFIYKMDEETFNQHRDDFRCFAPDSIIGYN